MRVVGGQRLLVFKVALVACMLVSIFLTHDAARQNTPSVVAESCGSPSALDWFTIDRVNRDKPFYQQASSATGVPWELLAAIHYRETGFGHTNPSNGQGIFQFVSGAGGPYPAGPVNDAEFTRQLTFMANRIQSDYVWRSGLPYAKRRLKATNEDAFRIKDVLFSYNGRASVYANQAASFGHSPATEPYEGSPYVMNRFDCQRQNMPMITRDYGGLDGFDTRYGAYTLYAELVGAGANSRSYDNVADASGFRAGNIISDAVFFDADSMNATEIQGFIADQVPNCDTNGEMYYNGKLRKDISDANPPPFICLKDYTNSETGENAGQIIAAAAAEYGVSPQVILSMIQAQKRLVNDDWPWTSQYRNAGCNSASVNECWWDQNAGFAKQVEFIASSLAEFSDPGVASNQFKVGQTYNIPYDSGAGCGGSNVRIENRATAALYNYTPFQPNPAALANPYGTGDSCTIDQNLDFYLAQTNWFGISNIPLESIVASRIVAENGFVGHSSTIKFTLKNQASFPNDTGSIWICVRDPSGKGIGGGGWSGRLGEGESKDIIFNFYAFVVGEYTARICGNPPGGPGWDPTYPETASIQERKASFIVKASPINVQESISLDKVNPVVGETVNISYTVKNNSDQPIDTGILWVCAFLNGKGKGGGANSGNLMPGETLTMIMPYTITEPGKLRMTACGNPPGGPGWVWGYPGSYAGSTRDKTVSVYSSKPLVISSPIKTDGDILVGETVNISYTVKNNSDQPIDTGILWVCAFLNGKGKGGGANSGNLMPGETLTMIMPYTITEPGKLRMTACGNPPGGPGWVWGYPSGQTPSHRNNIIDIASN